MTINNPPLHPNEHINIISHILKTTNSHQQLNLTPPSRIQIKLLPYHSLPIIRFHKLHQRHELGRHLPHLKINPTSIQAILHYSRSHSNELSHLLHFPKLPIKLGPRCQRYQERRHHRISIHRHWNRYSLSSQLFI